MRRGHEIVGWMMVLALPLVGACGGSTPWITLGKARNAHALEVVSWSGEAEQAERAQVTVKVTDGGSKLKLPCLTVAVIFQSGTQEVARERAEIDLSAFAAGGSAEFPLSVRMPSEPFDEVGIDLFRPVDEGLSSICEAAAVEG